MTSNPRSPSGDEAAVEGRVRITAQSALDQDRAPVPPAIEPRSVYLRSLMRSQLRLALACLVAFVGLLLLFVAVLDEFHELSEILVLGVPLRWLLLGFGVYPLIITTAVIYVRSSRRNEAAYRELLRLEQAE
ncbi:MAG: heavy metal transporter [Microbacteriaceae bacterium]